MAKTPLVQSLLRGLDIIEFAAKSIEGVTLPQIAAYLDVGRPTAFNLARTLVAKGYLVKTARPVRYRLGESLAQVLDLRQKQVLNTQLTAETKCIFDCLRSRAWVFAGEPSSGETLITLRVAPSRPEVLERPVHRMSPPYTTAVSLAVYAFCGEAERQLIEARYPFDGFGSQRWGDRQAFNAFLAEAREREYVLLETPQYRIVGPVYGHGRELRAVMGVSFGNDRCPTEAEQRCALSGIENAAKRIEECLLGEDKK